MRLSEKQKNALYPGLKLAFMAIGGIAVSTFLGPFMPLFFYNIAQAVAVAGEVYLIGIGYGIFNDILATGHSIDYFARGHNEGFWAIESDDRAANSFAWGIVATWWLSLPAAILFGIVALICNFVALPALSLFVPIMLAGAGITVIAADIYARVKKYNRLKENTVENDFEHVENPLLPIQTENVKTLEQKAGWLSCNDRNSFGYIVMLLFGLLGLIAYTTLRIVSASVILPTIVLSIPLQIGLLALPFVALTAGTIYLYCHNTEGRENLMEKVLAHQAARVRVMMDNCDRRPWPELQAAPAPTRSLSSTTRWVIPRTSPRRVPFNGKDARSALVRNSAIARKPVPGQRRKSCNDIAIGKKDYVARTP